MADVQTFDELLTEYLAQQAPFGWIGYTRDGNDQSFCWFASARNAAAWMSTQSPDRIGTPYEYVVSPAEESDRPGRLS